MSAGPRLHRFLGVCAAACLASACVAGRPCAADANTPAPAPAGAGPQSLSAADRPSPPALIDALLERVRSGRPLVVVPAQDPSGWASRLGWVQPLTHAQLGALRAQGHPAQLVAATFQPADTPAPVRSGLMDWLLSQGTPADPAAVDSAGFTARERRRLLTYLATPLAPGMTEVWELEEASDRLRLRVRQLHRPVVSVARALRRTGGHADPELRALLSDAITAQGLQADLPTQRP